MKVLLLSHMTWNVRNHILLVLMLFQECDDVIILHLSYLAYPHYIITVHIYGLHSVVLDAIVFKVCFIDSFLSR